MFSTPRHREIETGSSETSNRVSVFLYVGQKNARDSSKRVFILDRGTGTKPEGSDQPPRAESEPWTMGL